MPPLHPDTASPHGTLPRRAHRELLCNPRPALQRALDPRHGGPQDLAGRAEGPQLLPLHVRPQCGFTEQTGAHRVNRLETLLLLTEGNSRTEGAALIPPVTAQSATADTEDVTGSRTEKKKSKKKKLGYGTACP